MLNRDLTKHLSCPELINTKKGFPRQPHTHTHTLAHLSFSRWGCRIIQRPPSLARMCATVTVGILKQLVLKLSRTGSAADHMTINWTSNLCYPPPKKCFHSYTLQIITTMHAQHTHRETQAQLQKSNHICVRWQRQSGRDNFFRCRS